MENILKDKNENVSLGQLNYPSKSDAESMENMKENHNPKSLLEIATDSTSKFHLDASTPKIIKKSSSIKDSTFDMNLNISDSTPHHDNISENNSDLSFLLNGLNNLKLKGTDEASDDEDQFLSFNDMSNRVETLVVEKNNSEIKNPDSTQNESNEIVIVQKQENEEIIIVENNNSSIKDDQTGSNEEARDSVQNIEKREEIASTNQNVPIENCQSVIVNMDTEEPVHHNEKPENIAINDKNTSIESDQNVIDLSDEEKRLMDTVVIESDDSINPQQNEECITKTETILSANNDFENSSGNVISGNITQILNDSKPSTNLNATIDGPECVAAQSSDVIQEEINAENPITASDLNIDVEKSHSIQTQEESSINSTFDAPKNDAEPAEFPSSSNDLRENVCGNELSANLSKDKNSTFDAEEVPPNIIKNPFDNETRCSNQSFSECIQPNLDVEFKMPSAPVPSSTSQNNEEFTSSASYNFGDSDFEFLQKFGSRPQEQDIGRDSLLLKFDPLFKKPIPQFSSYFDKLAEEEEHLSQNVSRENFQKAEDIAIKSFDSCTQPIDEFPQLVPLDKEMNVEIMKDIVSENEKQMNKLECEETKLSSIDHHENQNNNKLMELENKMRMESEQREEVLLKRISEKDKQISKMNNVVKEYEKAIAELIAEKEQLVQNYEKKCTDLKHDSEVNANHLGSLELTFSDLHAKYERTKQIAFDLKEREETILQERNGLLNSLKMQEVRYDKMKAHAISQLEIANNKLAENLRNHQAEVTKLKAQLKKEEISRASINEQLIQKSKENAELVKICDELIGNHGNSHAD